MWVFRSSLPTSCRRHSVHRLQPCVQAWPVRHALGIDPDVSDVPDPFCTWLLMGYFRSIPFELEECALIDGRHAGRSDQDRAAARSARPDLGRHLRIHAFVERVHLRADLHLVVEIKTVPVGVVTELVEAMLPLGPADGGCFARLFTGGIYLLLLRRVLRVRTDRLGEGVAIGAQGERYQNIDVLRGFAALCVVWLHASEVFVTLPPVSAYGTWAYDVPKFLELGRAGVIAFFAISGFVVASTIKPPKSVGTREFVVKRFFRLYPAFWFALALTYLAIWLPQAKVVTAGGLLANITMLPTVFGVEAAMGHSGRWRLSLSSTCSWSFCSSPASSQPAPVVVLIVFSA